MPNQRKLDDWLKSYIDYNATQEATDKIHFWVGVSVISAVIKRQIWMARPRYTLYPNLYILIVAESGEARKSVAMDVGMDLLKDGDPDVFYLSGTMTPEGVVKHMNREKKIIKTSEGGRKLEMHFDSHIIIHMDELAESFGFDRARASKFTMLLTKIYGAQRRHTHTISSEDQIVLENLYPVMLAGTDPMNLKVLPEDAIGGLVGRIICVTEDKRKRDVAWETPEEANTAAELRKLLINDLKIISELEGEIKPTDAAKIAFADWYTELGKRRIDDRRMAAFKARSHDTALKLATVMSISKSNDLILEKDTVLKAIELIENQLPEWGKVADWAASSIYSQNRARFLEILRRQNGAGSRANVMKQLSISLDDVVILENSLEQEGTIKIAIGGKSVFYKIK